MLSALQNLRYSEATEKMIECWLALPRPEGQVCPKRSDFSSAFINSALSEVFLSEWESEGVLKIIQVGTKLDHQIGEDLTGKNIFDMTPEPLRDDERVYYRALRDMPCAGMMTRSAPNRLGRHFYYRTLQLPLLDPFNKVQYFVGTGVVLKAEQLGREAGYGELDDAELVERHFYDIGAGLPSREFQSAGAPQRVFFHPDQKS